MTREQNVGDEWSAYWKGRADLVTSRENEQRPGIETNSSLEGFWRSKLDAADRGSNLLELACGAGAVIQHATALGFKHLTGLDVSAEALLLMQKKFPDAKAVCASASEAPFERNEFDVIVSQFGFEYAGAEACLPVIANILAPGGRFIAITHYADGNITEECQKALAACEAFEDTRFIPAAMRLFQAQHAAELDPNPMTSKSLTEAANALAVHRDALAGLAARGHQLAGHALAGAQQLFERRNHYALSDILGWLEKLERENKAHAFRMKGMIAAALTEPQAEALLHGLSDLGFVPEPLKKFENSDPDIPSAWILAAERPR